MGTIPSKQASDKNQRKRSFKSKRSDEDFQKERSATRSVNKILLLGPSNSGKSTLLKQMRILHLNGFTDDELNLYKSKIYANILEGIETIIKALPKSELALLDTDVQFFIEATNNVDNATSKISAVRNLFYDPTIQECYLRCVQAGLMENAQYFFDNFDRITAPNYQPTVDDVLHCRVCTSGIVELNFTLKGLKFQVVDVGGQRSERRKWLHCFDNVKAVLFVVSLACYNQVLRDDSNTNCMQDSLDLFKSMCSSKYFEKASFILFLNKKDVLMEKIATQPITYYFKDYTGPQTYDHAVEYIQKQFSSRHRQAASPDSTSEQYIHVTCATDTKSIQFVLEACIDTIIATNMKICGLY